MLPSLRCHDEYVKFVNDRLGSICVPKAHCEVPEKLWLLDLTPIRVLMLNLYSVNHGRPAFTPEDMLRTFLAMVFCGITSPSRWVNDYLKDKSGFYAIISGFVPGDVPSVGAVYQFINRLMQLPTYCKQRQIRKKRKRLTKARKKKLKQDKIKVTKRHVGIVAKLAARFERISVTGEELYVPPEEAIANAILEECCLSESQTRGLLDKNHLCISGDGTKLPVHGSCYGKKVCKCDVRNCDCKRFYNAPDACVGYDSHRECYVYGHGLYQLTSFSTNHTAELPVYLLMTQAARHDSVSGSFAMNRATQRLGIDKGCFDAAHDATAFYQMADKLWNTEVFIPLNTTNSGNYYQTPIAQISEDGIPICAEGREMYYSGYCNDRDRQKWRCPLKATKKGETSDCSCSTSDYGRVVYTHPKNNARLFPKTPRTTVKYKQIYKHRTSAERVFKREKLDFLLLQFKTRSKGRHLFYALLTAIAVHVETWHQLSGLAS